MLETAKNLVYKAKRLISPHNSEVSADEVQKARDYIRSFWPKLERYHPKDDDTLLGLPKTYLVPAYEEGHEFDFNEMYYWDSYFMVQGLLDENHKELNLGILEDLATLF